MKIRLKFLKFLILPYVLAMGLLPAAPAQAEKADRNKPMFIESDNLRADDLKQITVATGKVVINKGTIVIRGARVEVRQDAEGYQFGTVTAAPGERAFFRQKREGLDEFIEGDGETIYYDGKADTVRFVRRAEMRRFKGAQLFDETSGNVIVYDNSADVFTVDGGGGGRVRTMLTPSPSAAVSVTPTVPTSATPLRSSATVGGGKK